jgi:hypothetical protein
VPNVFLWQVLGLLLNVGFWFSKMVAPAFFKVSLFIPISRQITLPQTSALKGKTWQSFFAANVRVQPVLRAVW